MTAGPETMRPDRAAARALPRAIVKGLAAGLRAHWRSVVAVAALVVAGLLFLVLLGAAGVLELGFMVTEWGTLWGPAWVAVSLTTSAFVVGLLIAMPLGLLRAYVPSVLRRPKGAPVEHLSFRRARELYGRAKAFRVVGGRKARRALLAPAYGVTTGYVEGIRGTPFFVQMWIVYFLVLLTYQGLPLVLKSLSESFFGFLRFPPVPAEFYLAGFLALLLNTAGYQAEVLRAGFQSVGQGQVDAAKAVGMRSAQIFLHITLPQALRLVVLPLTNEWISLFKASSILSFIAIQELMFQAKQLGVNGGRPFEAFAMVAVMYLLINVILGRTITYVERKRRIPGLGTPGGMPERPRSPARAPPAGG